MSYYNAYGLVYKYPWLEGGREMFDPIVESESAEPLVDYYNRLFSDYFSIYPELYQKLLDVFIFALDKKESGIVLTDDKLNIILFYTVKTLLTAFDNRILDNHVANLLSKLYHKRLLQENPQDLVIISKKMGLPCHFDRKGKDFGGVIHHFWVEIHQYVPIAALLRDSNYQLINRMVQNGKVFLIKDHMARLLQEVARREIIPDHQGISGELLTLLKKINPISAIINEIAIIIEEKKYSQSPYEKTNVYENMVYVLYPPCIKFILNKATNGVNLTHSERLHIAFFYANTNHTVEETVDVFRTLPDFDEKIARYNIEFSRGIGGKGKKYSVYSCAKLKSIKLCKATDKEYGDPICAEGVYRKGHGDTKVPIKNPKDFVFWKNVEIQRKLQNIPKK
ncbi:MAG: hypothetical protein JW776_09675 [Candidatus Lokiarchaeota archaeon]|nr:hypothetical protein [Candidatus Lokiarchaeota archaeon]